MSTPDQDQRAADQDAALEAAFVAGVLPDQDRRAPETLSVVEAAQPVVLAVESHRDAETKRLLAVAAHDTGYAQADAHNALRALWGVD